MLRLATAFLCLCFLVQAAAAQGADPREPRRYLGYGRLITDDVIGDGEDRWRTGNWASSRIWGPEWQGRLPETFGRVLEFRFNGEIVAPENLAANGPGDRPFVGILSFGLHTHFRRGATDMALGADLAVIGPQTGLDDFQEFLHDVVGAREISSQVRDAQIDNDVEPSLVFEAGREVTLGGGLARLRPFAEARAGLETMLRAGADLTIGQVGGRGLMVRDPVTGQRYQVLHDRPAGLSFVLGGDVAYVADSELLPDSRGLDVEDARARLRAGVHWENDGGTRLFYGLSWLSKEFESQRESQVVGSVRLNLRF